MKKFSEKYINSYSILNDSIIGFEFEFYSKLSYYKTLEMLNIELSPIKVHGFKQYHSSFTPDENNFKLEPDLSGGGQMCELITGPLSYFTARHYLMKVMKFIQTYSYTTDKCALHINISFKNKDISELNVLKHILRTNEKEIYEIFPSRENNIYAKSVKKLIPFKDYNFSNISIDIIKQTLKISNDKYYGINMANINDYKTGRIEYRYIGGKDYEYKTSDILELMNKFVINTYNNIGTMFEDIDSQLLNLYLEQKINMFKSFNTYDKFLVEFPNIDLQIDKNGGYDIVNAYYIKIIDKLYELIEGTEDLGECTINFYTTEQKIEVINGDITSLINLSNYDFINCTIKNGIFSDCVIVNSTVDNIQLNKSIIYNSDIENSKLINTNVENSDLINCFFIGGMMNGHMEDGVFRSGKIGQYGTISSSTKVITNYDNFFNIKYEDDGEDIESKKIDKKI